jgi:hypothetical protein
MDHTSVAIDADTGRGWHKPVKGWSPKKVLMTALARKADIGQKVRASQSAKLASNSW